MKTNEERRGDEIALQTKQGLIMNIIIIILIKMLTECLPSGERLQNTERESKERQHLTRLGNNHDISRRPRS